MTDRKTGKERLLKLADHLEHGKLGHDQFDFSVYNYRFKCGTAGCAIGECPIVWPDIWEFEKQCGIPMIRRYFSADGRVGMHGAMDFFSISMAESLHVFRAGGQNIQAFGGVFLNDFATKEQVAANIRAFVEKCMAGE